MLPSVRPLMQRWSCGPVWEFADRNQIINACCRHDEYIRFFRPRLADAVVMSDVRRQRGSPSTSCAVLQSRQFPAHAGDARTDQGLVADEFEGEGDQDRRKGGEPWTLRCLSDGGGRHPTAPSIAPSEFEPD